MQPAVPSLCAQGSSLDVPAETSSGLWQSKQAGKVAHLSSTELQNSQNASTAPAPMPIIAADSTINQSISPPPLALLEPLGHVVPGRHALA